MARRAHQAEVGFACHRKVERCEGGICGGVCAEGDAGMVGGVRVEILGLLKPAKVAAGVGPLKRVYWRFARLSPRDGYLGLGL